MTPESIEIICITAFGIVFMITSAIILIKYMNRDRW